jgi:hypothetical protein
MNMQKLVAAGVSAVVALSVSMPAFAEDDSSSASSSSTTSVSSSSSSTSVSSSSSVKMNGRMKKEEMKMMRSSAAATVNGACVSAAVDKRDTALISALGTFHTSVSAALTVRKDALKAAWVLTDVSAREAAVKAAWKAFGTSAREAKHAFRTAKKTAWKTFKTEARACGAAGADSSGESADNQI